MGPVVSWDPWCRWYQGTHLVALGDGRIYWASVPVPSIHNRSCDTGHAFGGHDECRSGVLRIGLGGPRARGVFEPHPNLKEGLICSPLVDGWEGDITAKDRTDTNTGWGRDQLVSVCEETDSHLGWLVLRFQHARSTCP